ncbi:MAG TPA: hypothetical protein VJU52_13560 [Flavobacterium sp.]|nr:hypothetical protein [Flavobacterium sp.]
MDQQSLFFTSIVAIVATALMLMLIQFLAKKQNIKSEKEQKISISYSIWIASIMIAFFMLLKVALGFIENSIEVLIYSKTIDNVFIAVMQKIAIFSGFTFLITFLAYYTVHIILSITIGKRNDSLEIERENIGYFIFKGIILILLVFSLITIFEHFLGWFTIKVDTPFYH